MSRNIFNTTTTSSRIAEVIVIILPAFCMHEIFLNQNCQLRINPEFFSMSTILISTTKGVVLNNKIRFDYPS